MVEKKITYTDYDGTERTEVFRFQLTKTELTKMRMGTDGGLENYLQTIVDAKDGKAIMKVFEEMMDASYGEKSADGRRFMKNPELLQAFKETPAYDIIWTELVTSPDAANMFMSQILPKDIQQQIANR